MSGPRTRRSHLIYREISIRNWSKVGIWTWDLKYQVQKEPPGTQKRIEYKRLLSLLRDIDSWLQESASELWNILELLQDYCLSSVYNLSSIFLLHRIGNIRSYQWITLRKTKIIIACKAIRLKLPWIKMNFIWEFEFVVIV